MNQELERTEELMALAGKKGKKNKLIAIVIIAAILAAGVGVFAGIKLHSGQQIKDQLKIADAKLKEGKYEEAIAAYDKVIKMDDKNADAYEGKADAYAKSGNYKASIDPYKKAIKYNKEKEEIYDKAITSAIRCNDIKTAEEIIETMHDNIPDSKNKDLDYYLEARKAYQKVLDTVMHENKLVTSNETIENLLFEDDLMDIDDNRFAILDIDGDGEEELLLEINTAPVVNSDTYLIKYEGDGNVRLENRYLMPVYYANGDIKGLPHHLPEFSSDAYFLAKYDHDKKEWNQYFVRELLKEMFFEGAEDAFPSDKDKNGNGKVYYICSDYDYENNDYSKEEYYDDGEEYDKWYKEQFNSVKIDVKYEALTQENVDEITTFSSSSPSGKTDNSSKKFFSPKQLGMNKFNVETGENAVLIRDVNDKSLVYSKSHRVSNDYETYLKGGKKELSAKLTSSTKYYIGDISKLNYDEEDYDYISEWLEEVSKREFLKEWSKENGSSAWDRILVENGNVKAVAIKCQWAE